MDFPEQLRKLVLAQYEALSSPRSLMMHILVRYSEWEQVVDASVTPGDYIDSPFGAEKLRRDLQATELLRKYPGFDLGRDLKTEAVSQFYSNEKVCYQTNLRLSPLLNGEILHRNDGHVLDVVDTCRKWLRQVFGTMPENLDFSFGKGAVFESKDHHHDHFTLIDKMVNKPSITPSAQVLLPFWEASLWGRQHNADTKHTVCDVVPGNRFTTVPKDATKLRGICIEPSLNVWFQLGIGRHLKKRLSRFGLDLTRDDMGSVGQELHRTLAAEGSLFGHLSTIDLSNASDNVASNLVKLLLPGLWYDLLDSVRSKKTLIDGKWVVLEKFSSMGNGFTFELETAIFAALAHACGGRVGIDTFVYGDDIITPTAVSLRLLPVLRFFGFTPNERKTFVNGPFRESCGGDFFVGEPVRAYYIKKVPSQPSDWFQLHNGLYKQPLNTKVARSLIKNALPRKLRLFGPQHLGDIVLHGPGPYRLKSGNSTSARGACSSGNKYYWIRTWQPVNGSYSLNRWDAPCAVLAALLLGTESSGVVPRGFITGYREKWVSFG